MGLTYRDIKGSPLSFDEMDNNTRHFTGSHSITGSLTLTSTLTLSPVSTLPAAVNGALIVSSSGDLYFGSGSAWKKVSLS